MAACHYCRILLEDLARILDRIQLTIRLLRLAMDLEPTEETPQWEIDEKIDMLQHHLVTDSETMDYLFMVLNTRCDMCGNEFWIRKPQDADPKN